MISDRYISHEMYGCLKQYWGFKQFRPWQEETILAILEGQESLTVLPTGGGKSLCFQLPALLMEGMAVVISPLISLMKDQVDGLREMGIDADYLNSSLSVSEQELVVDRIEEGQVKLLYLSPERLQGAGTLKLLKSAGVSFFVIDEAHCISHWGHDFREDYRHLGIIKEKFPGARVHAFTATATSQVQKDILEQLSLIHPVINIASVDRANLSYRVMPRSNLIQQIAEVLKKHPRQAGIIYCLRRDDVDRVSRSLNALGYNNLPYHAGMSDEQRHLNQERFIREEVDIIVATVAFGMGIDRSDIRFVIHAAMPKSIEHYHQETGRAGRDGLPAACYMFYGGADYRVWSFLSGKSANRRVMMEKLGTMYNFCTQPQCRHKAFVDYFGQEYPLENCQSCDYCLGEVEMVDDPLDAGQRILSCVESVRFGDGQGFGAGHIANLLRGNLTEQVGRWRHQENPGFAAMSGYHLAEIRYLIDQLIGQGFLEREGEYETLRVSESGKEVLAGRVKPILARPLAGKKKKEANRRQKEKKAGEWAGVDQELFELLRGKRSELARRQGVPAYIIFGDRSLKEMAGSRPITREAFREVFGVGEHKLKIYSDEFIKIIRDYLK